MATFTAPSGATILITAAPWKDAKLLKMAIEQVLSEHGLGLDINVANIIAAIDGSPKVDAFLWPCLMRCTRNDAKIVESTFDDPVARQDYYEIVEACLKENFAPLVEKLSSKFAALMAMKQSADQKLT